VKRIRVTYVLPSKERRNHTFMDRVLVKLFGELFETIFAVFAIFHLKDLF